MRYRYGSKLFQRALVLALMGLGVDAAAADGASNALPSSNDTLQEILVTANKRGAESLQNIPISITALTGQDLERGADQGIRDYARSIPGLSIIDAGPNQQRIKLRGVSGSTESEPQETVAIYYDDVNVTNPGGTNNENNSSPDLNLFDIARIEVLKGPQGTLYGAGSMGGTIRVITNPPKTDEYEAEVQSRLSTTKSGDSSYGGDAMVNIPLVKNQLALRLVGTYRQDGGYIDNVSPLLNANNYNNDASWLVRGTLLYTPLDNVDISLKYMHRDALVHGLNATPVDQYLTSDYLVRPRSDSSLDLVNAVANVRMDGIMLTSSTSYIDRKDLNFRDLTPLAQGYFSLIAPDDPPAPAVGLYNQNRNHEFAQELRVASDNSGPLKYVFGLYYSKLEKNFIQDGIWPGLSNFLSTYGTPDALAGKGPIYSPVTGDTDWNFYLADVNQDLEQIAGFGEATYSVTDKLDVTLGGRAVRITQHSIFDANPEAVFVTADAAYRAAQLTDKGFNPKATVSYQAAPNVLVYATAARGFRPGGFNQPVSTNGACLADFAAIGYNPNNIPGFKSDSIWSYELGNKLQTESHRVENTSAVYQENWSNIQLRDPLSCGFTIFNTASKARIRGFEDSFSFQIVRGLTVSLNGAYTNAILLTASPASGALAGEHLLGIPDFTIGGSAEYNFNLIDGYTGYVRAEDNYASSYNSYFSQQFYNGLPKNNQLGGYAIANLRFGLVDPNTHWEAQVFINNLFDKIGDTGSQNDIFGDVVFKTRPVQAGLQVSKHF